MINNNASRDGGGILLQESEFQNASFNNLTCNSNTAQQNEGCIKMINATSIIERSKIMNNKANVGGGTHMNESRITLINGILSSNNAEDGGGMTAINNSKMRVEESEIQSNNALYQVER